MPTLEETSATAAPLLGREPELEAIDATLATIMDGTCALVLEGEAGIGKTTLWNAAVRRSQERGYTVLSSRPVESEAALAFAAFGDLLEPVLPGALEELPAPQRSALEVALLLAESPGPPPDQRAIAVAFLGILRALAGTRPVVVAIDDAQWLDAGTAAVLEFALRRLLQEHVALVVALRSEGRGFVDPAVSRFTDEHVRRLHLAPLSAGALHRMIRSRLGIALRRPTLLRVHEGSRGNPFYALEITRALEQSGGHLVPGEPLKMPTTLQELLLGRIRVLPTRVQDVLLLIALLADPTVAIVGAADENPSQTTTSIEAAAAAGVIEVDGERIAFAHPLLREAVVADAALDRRRQHHRRLAGVVGDLEQRARHLALATIDPDPAVADALENAARHAASRGAPRAAAELSELAIERTPGEHRSDLHRRRRQAADYHLTAGEDTRGRTLLEALVEELPPGGDRADVLLRLAEGTTIPTDQVSVELCERALIEAGDDRRRLARIEVRMATFSIESGSRATFAHGRRALEHAEQAGDTALLGLCLARLATCELFTADMTPGLLDRALALGQPTYTGYVFDSPTFTLALWRLLQGRLDESRVLLEDELSRRTMHGEESGCVAVRSWLAELEWRAGAWTLAAEHAARAYELAAQIGVQDSRVPVYRAFIDLHRGDVTAAHALLEEAMAIASRVGDELGKIDCLSALGVLSLSLGDAAAAERQVRPLIDWLVKAEWAFATSADVPYALEAMIAVGKLSEARTLLMQFEREAQALESPCLFAVAGRVGGMLETAEGNLDGARLLLERALDLQEEGAWPFERGRTLLALGSLQRRAKQKRAARESLRAALALFGQLGAAPWAVQARSELRRIGGRRASPATLTPTEQRVAALVAEGRTNKEVAAALVVAPRTVEWNLTKIYSKLGVRSRAELARRFATERHP